MVFIDVPTKFFEENQSEFGKMAEIIWGNSIYLRRAEFESLWRRICRLVLARFTGSALV
jgi:hypothetical protein